MSQAKRIAKTIVGYLEKNLAITLILIGTTLGLILEIYG